MQNTGIKCSETNPDTTDETRKIFRLTDVPKKLLGSLIRLYQIMTFFVPAICRFEPSCSEYSRQAILKYGIFKGSWLMIRRISSCHPYNPGGYDPVP